MNMHLLEGAISPAEVPFGPSATEAKIAELATLKPIDYEQCREAEAKALKVRVSFLDKMVEAERPAETCAESSDPFEAVEPWPEPVDGVALLAELRAAILRFCVLPDHTAPLMAVWVLHAWAHEASDISPVLAFVSPEKRCGKTTALSVIGALVPKSMHAVNISTSVLFRVVEKFTPTVIIDEADTFLNDNDELRGVLNGGHNRFSAYVWRSVGDDFEPRRFRVWAPKCIAMIGKLPDTLEDRALVVHLRRKQDGEIVERFRGDRLNEFLPLRRKAARWAEDNLVRLHAIDPVVPGELNDRAQDNARAICAIADVAGGEWPTTIRAALLGSAGEADDEPQSAGVLLLRDIAEIFKSRSSSRIGSTQLCEALCAIEESPWGDWRRGLSITTRGVVKLLKPFGVRPSQDRFGSFYRLVDFADAFNRYLATPPEEIATSAPSAMPDPGAIENIKEIKARGTCGGSGTCSEGGTNRDNDNTWEGEF